MLNIRPWIHPIETIIGLLAHKKASTNANAYKHKCITTLFLNILISYPKENIYTEASKSTVEVGAAVVWNNVKLMYKFPGVYSIFTA